MIAPMKKAWIVIQDTDRLAALADLRELGLVHLETQRPSGKIYEERTRELDAVSRSMNILPPVKDRVDEVRLGTARAVALAGEVVALEGRSREIYEELGQIKKELERCAPWGDFEPADLAYLTSHGMALRFFETEGRKLSLLPAGLDHIVLGSSRKRVRIVVLAARDRDLGLGADFVEFVPPSTSPRALEARSAQLQGELGSIEAFYGEASRDLASLKEAAAFLAQGIAFETANSSFEDAGGLLALRGFVPAKEAEALKELARRRSWAILLDDPAPEDLTPTKVENGPVVRIIGPVFDFLGIVPGYGEYEISPWFLGFFALFTAMIFGDGGYGALMLVAWAFSALKARRAGGKQPDSLKLLFLIASLTIAWGAVTGTWFSIRAELLPPFFQALTVWPISGANPAASKNIQVLCFVLGAVQLSVARIKNVIRDLPDPKAISQVGSLALVVGMFFVVLNLVVDPQRFPLSDFPFAVPLILGGFAANMVFGAYEGNVFKSALEGLKNIIPNFLGAVGVFADIVSYIRLWALGLAGASLAGIINTLGGGLVKAALIGVFGIVILVFGHALNLVLSVLSVVVHAIRLNILEFSCNHLGMQWSGIAYDPFRVTHKGSAPKGKEQST